MAIPNIGKENIYAALKYIDANGVLPGYKSKIYDLAFEGKMYPPKYVVAVARYLKDGSRIDTSDFNAVEARNFFEGNGFEISTRNKWGEKIQAWWNAHKNDSKIKEIIEDSEFIYQEQKDALVNWLDANVSGQGLKLVASIPKPANYKDDEFDSLCGSLAEQERESLKRLILTLQKNKPISLDNYGRKIPLAYSLARYKLKQSVGDATQRSFDYYKDSVHLLPLSKEKIDKACSKLKVDNTDESLLRFFEELSLDNSSCVNENNQTKLYCEILWNALGLDEKKEPVEEILIMDDYSEYVEFLRKNHNVILHGAPGTGKTYLAKEIAKAMGCGDNEIGFVQFHQSFDYTDFVEGLRPVNQESNQIGFERRDGVFKEFCIKAMIKSSSDSKTTGKLNSNPVVWKVSLAGTGDNPIRQDCLENGYIRIGWKEYGDVENFNDFDNYINGGKNVLRAFQNEMKEGDIVVSCFSENETDAIGIVTGSYNYDEIRFGDYPRFRNVEWLVKNIKEDIVAINNNRKFTLSTIYKSNITAEDAIKIVNKHKTSISLNDRPFVFIIDEINRGEMSKIFGELFFSIDPGYRGEMGRIKTQYQNLVPNGDVFAKGFFVPKNVYIIGTMNDIDRSVESMDFAMRRRFAFKEIKAEDRIAMLKDPENGIGEYADKAEKRMNALNEAIGSETVGLSHAYDIGPAYFLKLKDCDYSFDKLWDYHIKGLVKEYLRGMDENGEKFKALKDAYFHSETNAPKKEESESK